MPVPSWNHPPPLVSVSNLGPWFLDRPTISHPAHQPASQSVPETRSVSLRSPGVSYGVTKYTDVENTSKRSRLLSQHVPEERSNNRGNYFYLQSFKNQLQKRFHSLPYCHIGVSVQMNRHSTPSPWFIRYIYLRNKLLKTWKESFISLCDSDL